MTKFLPSYIPAEITTLEQLRVWIDEIFVYLYPTKTVVETLDTDGNEIKSVVIEGNKYYYTAPTTPEWRYVSRCAIKLSPNHHVYGRIYEHALDIGDDAIPAQMRRAA